ncbi:DUF819 domain-containing protein [Sphingobacterium spiritivorum]|uniref:DUF819 family protein n=1 Tax=Sphingobacterium spiritivorum TaxID=258 RepID=UPI003DA33A65
MEEKLPIVQPLITNDAVVFGLLMGILGFIFYTSSKKEGFWARFYKYCPSLVLCYFVPALLNSFNIINGEVSQLDEMASTYLLPTSLIFFTIGIDIQGLKQLGSKSLIMFFTGAIGIIIGGPIAIALIGSVFPSILHFNGEETWRGFAAIAGSWIGGSANQAAMFKVFGSSESLFGQMVAVDVLISSIWMGLLIYGAQKSEKIDAFFKADTSSLKNLEQRLESIHLAERVKDVSVAQWFTVLGVGFAGTGLAHLMGNFIGPWFKETWPASEQYSLTSITFWVIIIATTIGMVLSFTRARKLENYGASNMGSILLYILVATIGMKMDIKALLDNPVFFLVGIVWILIHIILMLGVAKIIKAPFFYVAVASQANIGGAASAPVVAAAFNKYLAPVGVLLAVLGYAVGTYGGYICGLLMQYVSGLFQ